MRFTICAVAVLFFMRPPASSAQTHVEVVGSPEGLVGERLLYQIREEFRESNAFRLVEQGGFLRLYLVAMPRIEDSPNTSAIYTIVWTALYDDRIAFLDVSLGYTGTDTVASTAESLVAATDRLVSQLLR